MDFENVVKIVKIHEGLALKAYKCPAGKITIGYGRNLEDRGITISTANNMLCEDISEFYHLLMKFDWFPHLSEIRAIVCLDMMYNLGSKGFLNFKKMIACLEAEDYNGAAEQIVDSKYYRQTGQRARDNVFMMARNEYPRGIFDRKINVINM